MAKRILITAGTVYGRLDDNKLVGNRLRGIWATKLALYLQSCMGNFEVTLLVPDTFPKERLVSFQPPSVYSYTVIEHNGFDDYMEKCLRIAPDIDVAIMAAGVVNWIPAEPFIGKMPTEGYSEGDIIDIPFRLAPRVIDRMREAAGKQITLIGCKMTAGATNDELIRQAYKTLIGARCNAVIANDLSNLRMKKVVYPDRTIREFGDNFEAFDSELKKLVGDVFWKSIPYTGDYDIPNESQMSNAFQRFDAIVNKYRQDFVKPIDNKDMVFGSLAVKIGNGTYLVSPREKGEAFSSKDASIVIGINRKSMETRFIGRKATLNAPLLIRMLANDYEDDAVLHLHKYFSPAPMVDYAPPGTDRDNNRHLPAKTFNIDGHGFIAILNHKNEPVLK